MTQKLVKHGYNGVKTDLITKLFPQNKPKSVDNCGYTQVHKPQLGDENPENPIKSSFLLWITMWIMWIPGGNDVIYTG